MTCISTEITDKEKMCVSIQKKSSRLEKQIKFIWFNALLSTVRWEIAHMPECRFYQQFWAVNFVMATRLSTPRHVAYLPATVNQTLRVCTCNLRKLGDENKYRIKTRPCILSNIFQVRDSPLPAWQVWMAKIWWKMRFWSAFFSISACS